MRHYAMAGDVLWNEQGMRYSWKVMVREKMGSLTYRVERLKDGRVWDVNPSRYLQPRQLSEMSSQPDMIVQLAHYIRYDFYTKGRGDVAVRADALVSLNGRPASRLIDPNVDLTRIHDLQSIILDGPKGEALDPCKDDDGYSHWDQRSSFRENSNRIVCLQRPAYLRPCAQTEEPEATSTSAGSTSETRPPNTSGGDESAKVTHRSDGC